MRKRTAINLDIEILELMFISEEPENHNKGEYRIENIVIKNKIFDLWNM